MGCNKASNQTAVQEKEANTKSELPSQVASVGIPSVDFEGFAPLLHQNDGTTYVVNFWATWCAPCVKELPHFERLNEAYASQNVKVVLVSLDFPKKLDSQLIPFVKKRNLQSEVIHLNDPRQNEWIPKVSKEWSGAIPATVIYNAERRAFYERSFTYIELENELKPFLQ